MRRRSRASGRGRVSRSCDVSEGEKTSRVKKKILDSCSKLSTIHSRRKKDGKAITSRFTVLTETPSSFEIDRRRKGSGFFGSRQIRKTRGPRPSRGGQPSTRLSGLSIKSARRR